MSVGKHSKNFVIFIDGRWVTVGKWVAVRWGVAVAGWEWWRWIEEIRADRMVVVGGWQWQYWRSYECWKTLVIFWGEK
jgi:hypothetical protein